MPSTVAMPRTSSMKWYTGQSLSHGQPLSGAKVWI